MQIPTTAAAAPFAAAPDNLFALAQWDIASVDAVPARGAGVADVRACPAHGVEVLKGASAKTKSDAGWAPLHAKSKARLAALDATPPN
jgi:hypothetical protein